MTYENNAKKIDVTSKKRGRKPSSQWGLRALTAGLDQTTLAVLAGVSPNSVSRALREKWTAPRYLYALIVAWELLTPDQRAQLVAAVAGVGEKKPSE